jgi:hypothetical protein
MLGNSTETVQSTGRTNQELPSANKKNLLENFIPFQADEYFVVEREQEEQTTSDEDEESEVEKQQKLLGSRPACWELQNLNLATVSKEQQNLYLATVSKESDHLPTNLFNQFLEDLVDPSVKADFWNQEITWNSIHELFAKACQIIELKGISCGEAKVAAKQASSRLELPIEPNDYPVLNYYGIPLNDESVVQKVLRDFTTFQNNKSFDLFTFLHRTTSQQSLLLNVQLIR